MEEHPKPKSRSRSPSPGNNLRRNRNISRDQLLEALKRKKECNAIAQSVVETCLLTLIDPKDFLEKIKYINQNHYNDIVDERSILHLCGYPVCNNTLTEFPKSKYKISTKTNKVFDLEERIKFCSSHCFKASQYIKEQILISPLWLRDQVILPEFKLLNLN